MLAARPYSALDLRGRSNNRCRIRPATRPPGFAIYLGAGPAYRKDLSLSAISGAPTAQNSSLSLGDGFRVYARRWRAPERPLRNLAVPPVSIIVIMPPVSNDTLIGN